MTIDLDKVDDIDKDLKMVIAVGSYGTCPNIDKLLDFCKQNKMVLILDNAPSFGVKFKNKFLFGKPMQIRRQNAKRMFGKSVKTRFWEMCFF